MQVLRRESVKFLFLHKKRRAVARLMGAFCGEKSSFFCLAHRSVIARLLYPGEREDKKR